MIRASLSDIQPRYRVDKELQEVETLWRGIRSSNEDSLPPVLEILRTNDGDGHGSNSNIYVNLGYLSWELVQKVKEEIESSHTFEMSRETRAMFAARYRKLEEGHRRTCVLKNGEIKLVCELNKGDVFKLYEPSGKLVENSDGASCFTAMQDACYEVQGSTPLMWSVRCIDDNGSDRVVVRG